MSWKPEVEGIEWLHTSSSEGRAPFRIGRAGDELVAEWVGVARLRASRSGTLRDFRGAPDIDDAILNKLQKNVVDALLRHCQGGLTLHAASFATVSGAVACLGASGDGKSTLTAAACLRAGVSLVGDDMAPIVLDRSTPLVVPTDSVTWLLPDARAALGHGAPETFVEKRSVRAARTTTQAVPLRALIRLAWHEGPPSLRRLSGQASFELVCLSAVRFVLDEPEVHLRDFDQTAKLIARVPVYELARPRDLKALDATIDLISPLLEASP